MKGLKTMGHYEHLSIIEREKLLILHTEKKSLRQIARELGRSVSTISRELKRNTKARQSYSAVEAQWRYAKRRKKCRRHKVLENKALKELVGRLFLEEQWSPEEISNRLILEKNPYKISYATIYRAIYQGLFDVPDPKRPYSTRGSRKKLRHRGKPRKSRKRQDLRGQMSIPNRIHDRPAAAQGRKRIGDWEADTVLGKANAACLLTLTDRHSRYLLAGKIHKKTAPLGAEKMISLLNGVPKKAVKSITPDRGKEFSHHAKVTQVLNVPFYFADPHAPWQRGTNENTNGLLREYFPKSFDFDACSDLDIAAAVDKLNKRPRKCLGWKSPFEVFFHCLLHLT